MKASTRQVWRGGVVAVAIVVAALGVFILFSQSASDLPLAVPARPVPPELIRLDSQEGTQLLFESEAHLAFAPLVSFFETQKSLTHCGPASIAMVLNALAVPAPLTAEHRSYRLFTQDNVLNARTDDIIRARAVAERGMALADLADVLRAYGVAVEVRYAGESDIKEFRTLAKDYLGTADHYVIVNYSRAALGQDGPGHISPLAAYDADSDRFLILDVARYKAPAVWVSTAQLFTAMAEPLGTGEARTRGFLLIRAAADQGG